MGNRKRMKDHYRRFSFLSDIEGMKDAIGEMRGMFFPQQPDLNRDVRPHARISVPDENWFIQTITDKIAGHPQNAMEYPFYNEPIFDAPLVGFVRGDDPIFDQFKKKSSARIILPRGRS